MRLGRQVSLIGDPRFAKMHLIIDHAGHQHLPGGIDHRRTRRTDPGTDLIDATIDHQQITLRDLAFVHYPGVANQQLAHQS